MIVRIMSLNKAIKSGKEKRKPYRGAKAIDHTCRNHGGCPVCIGNRTNKNKEKNRIAIEEIINESQKTT